MGIIEVGGATSKEGERKGLLEGMKKLYRRVISAKRCRTTRDLHDPNDELIARRKQKKVKGN